MYVYNQILEIKDKQLLSYGDIILAFHTFPRATLKWLLGAMYHKNVSVNVLFKNYFMMKYVVMHD